MDTIIHRRLGSGGPLLAAYALGGANTTLYCSEWVSKVNFLRLKSEDILVIRMQERRPEMMPGSFPVDFLGAILQPVRQGHITVGQVDCVCSSGLGCDGVLLGQYEAHNLTELGVLEEELDMDRVGRRLCDAIYFVLDEIVFRDHFHVRIVCVYIYWSTKSDCNGAITGEQCPPDSLPKSLVGPAQLRRFHTGLLFKQSIIRNRDSKIPKIPREAPQTFDACLNPAQQ